MLIQSKWILILSICSTLSVFGQGAVDTISIDDLTLDEIEVLQTRGAIFDQQGNRMTVDVKQLDQMPRILGISDPLRYIQSTAGIVTNNETRAGIYIQGCDAYQSMVSINGAAVLYPTHLLGLFSTMNAPHFSTMVVEQSAHRADMSSRVGGLVDMQTPTRLPDSIRADGTIGLIASEATVAIPIAKHSSLTLSARTSYIDLLYGKWMTYNNLDLGYHFMDFNLTWEYHPTDHDRLTVTGFYSRDKLSIVDLNNDISIPWQNLVACASWNHRGDGWSMRQQFSFSGYQSSIGLGLTIGRGNTDARMGELVYRGRYDWPISDNLSLRAGTDYTHYMIRPVEVNITTISHSIAHPSDVTHSDEANIYADVYYTPLTWLHGSLGLRLPFYAYQKQYYVSLDPRLNIEFIPHEEHHIYLHAGRYHQFFHKAALTSGGLPTDFYFAADNQFRPEEAYAVSLKYQADLYHNEWMLSIEGYFKQLYNIVESSSDLYQLVNNGFNYEQDLLRGDGRNYGVNVMVQRTRGIVTGSVSYTLGWAKRRLPELDGSEEYIYSASNERRHDLKVMINSRFCKRWSIGAMFFLASGIPCTQAEEVYMLDQQMICTYSYFNGSHLPLYHRLDLSVGCDIIQKNNHFLGINLSICNVYNQKNAQFLVYLDNLRPDYGSGLSFITPSISIYGRW